MLAQQLAECFRRKLSARDFKKIASRSDFEDAAKRDSDLTSLALRTDGDDERQIGTEDPKPHEWYPSALLFLFFSVSRHLTRIFIE